MTKLFLTWLTLISCSLSAAEKGGDPHLRKLLPPGSEFQEELTIKKRAGGRAESSYVPNIYVYTVSDDFQAMIGFFTEKGFEVTEWDKKQSFETKRRLKEQRGSKNHQVDKENYQEPIDRMEGSPYRRAFGMKGDWRVILESHQFKDGEWVPETTLTLIGPPVPKAPPPAPAPSKPAAPKPAQIQSAAPAKTVPATKTPAQKTPTQPGVKKN
ncbi:MAG: hypothetical protein HY539_04965 [Deltaproteobacteria bacterium]|nr:hypothetical protein [Deltaproteobacteria bacterium]